MKKFIVSAAVILTFFGYAFYKREIDEDAPVKSLSLSANASNIIQPTESVPTGTAPTPDSPETSPTPDSTPIPTTTTPSSSKFKNGDFTGDSADAYYGNIQVKLTISGDKITDVQFLQYPNDRSTSRHINGQAMPYLRSEILQAQNPDVDIISGATDTSMAFRQSARSALLKAQN